MAETVVTQATAPASPPANTTFLGLKTSGGVVVLPSAFVEVLGAADARTFQVWSRVESGAQDVPTSIADVATVGALDARLDAIRLVNDTDAPITVQVLDGNDQPIIPSTEMPARSRINEPLHGLSVTGIQWVADAVGVVGYVWGRAVL